MFSKIPELVSTDPRVSVGRFTYGDPQLMLWSEDEHIEIGAFCSIANEVVIFGGGEHRTDWVTTFPLRIAFDDNLAGKDGHPATKGTTKIGNDVWIGFRSIILSGITIGDGAVIGAGSIVASNVPPYAVVVGNPAKVLKFRFSDEIIKKLLDISWWNWESERINKSIPMLCSTDIQNFINNNEPK